MAHRPRDTEEEVSLFPFLNVLVCIIGTLTLVIATQMFTQMDTPAAQASDAYNRTRSEIAAIEKLIAQLNAEFAEKRGQQDEKTQREQRQLDEQQKHLQSLRERIDEFTKMNAKLKESMPPPLNADQQRESLSLLKSQTETAAMEVQFLKQQVAKMGGPGPEADVAILPTGSGVGAFPYFVECDANRLIVHIAPTPLTVLQQDLKVHAEYAALLAKIKNEPESILIFLVRDDGLNVLRAAQAHATRSNVNHGKIPVIGHGRIDLSYFTKHQK